MPNAHRATANTRRDGIAIRRGIVVHGPTPVVVTSAAPGRSGAPSTVVVTHPTGLGHAGSPVSDTQAPVVVVRVTFKRGALRADVHADGRVGTARMLSPARSIFAHNP